MGSIGLGGERDKLGTGWRKGISRAQSDPSPPPSSCDSGLNVTDVRTPASLWERLMGMACHRHFSI